MDGGGIAARVNSSDGGIQKVFKSPATRVADYSGFFTAQLKDWLAAHPDAPVYIAGAAGGRDGWVETAYSIAPQGLMTSAATCTKSRRSIWVLRRGGRFTLRPAAPSKWPMQARCHPQRGSQKPRRNTPPEADKRVAVYPRHALQMGRGAG